MEEKLIRNCEKMLIEYPDFIDNFTFRHFKHWSYFTDEGRAFCTRIRILKRKKSKIIKDRTNPFKWEKFVNSIDFTNYLLPKIKIIDDPIPRQECLICLDKYANTQVFPCLLFGMF